MGQNGRTTPRCNLARTLGAMLALGVTTVHAQDVATLDGTWEGSLTMVHGAGLRQQDSPPQTWRLVINGDTARAFILRGGKVEEIKPGKFRLPRDRSNAVMTAVDSGRDTDGEWIETEAFELLFKSPGDVLVTFAGAVNNVSEPLDKPTSKFMTLRTGEFHPAK